MGQNWTRKWGDTHMHSLSAHGRKHFMKKHAFPFYALCQPAREDSSCGKSSTLLERTGYGEGQETVPRLGRMSAP